MLPLRFRKVATTNNAQGIADQKKLDKIVDVIIERVHGKLDPAALATQREFDKEKIEEMFREVTAKFPGVCAAMICLWALEIILADGGAAAAPKAPDMQHAAVLQGKYLSSTLSRMVRGKVPFEDGESAGHKYMYKTKGLGLIGAPVMGSFPGVLPGKPFPGLQEFKPTAERLCVGIETNAGSPHVLSLQLSTGGHAIGLHRDGGKYVVFDPNLGLYEFPDRDIFTQSFNQHLMQGAVKNTPWTLQQIGRRAA